MPALAPPTIAARRLFWAGIWLALVLVAIKARYLGVPSVGAFDAAGDYLRSLASISYVDVLFATAIWLVARLALALVGGRRLATRVITVVFLALAALSCTYALASVVVFGVFGGFLTYPMLALIGDVQMLSSSAATYLTRGVVVGLVALPLAYVALVLATVRVVPRVAARGDSAAASPSLHSVSGSSWDITRFPRSGRPSRIDGSPTTRSGCSSRRGGRSSTDETPFGWPIDFRQTISPISRRWACGRHRRPWFFAASPRHAEALGRQPPRGR